MRLSSAAFGLMGACLVLVGVACLVFGVPLASKDLAPLGGLGDIGRRLAELSLPLSATAGAIVTAGVSVLVATRRLRVRAAALELLVLGLATEACLVALAHRAGYDSNGTVLVATVAALSGGVAIVVAAFAAAASRD